jgi:hypothetical protein
MAAQAKKIDSAFPATPGTARMR